MTKTIATLVLTLGLAACENTGETNLTTAVDTTPRAGDTAFTTRADTTPTDDRAEWRDDLRERMNALDARIEELRARGTAGARVQLFELEQRRNELAADLDEAADVTDDRWEELKSDLSGAFEQLEADVDAALQ